MPNTIDWGTIIVLVVLCYVTVVILLFMHFRERMFNFRIGRLLLKITAIVTLFCFVAMVAVITKIAF